MVPCLAVEQGAEGRIVIFTVVEETLAAMGIDMVVSAAVGAKGTREARAAGEVVAEAGEVVEVREVM